MEMNARKCNVISFTKAQTQLSYGYRVDGSSLDRVTSIKDLGVTINCKLSFDEHINTTISKAFALLGFIRRNAREFRDVYALKALYCSFVRSVLEYAVQVWAPYKVIQKARIERVQRCFVRFALRRLPWSNPRRLPPYEQRSLLFRLEPLEQRRIYLRLVFAFDILSNRIDCPNLLQQANLYVPARNFRRRPLFLTTRHRTVYGLNHPLETCFNLLNDIDFDFHVTRDRFKNSIRPVV